MPYLTEWHVVDGLVCPILRCVHVANCQVHFAYSLCILCASPIRPVRRICCAKPLPRCQAHGSSVTLKLTLKSGTSSSPASVKLTILSECNNLDEPGCQIISLSNPRREPTLHAEPRDRYFAISLLPNLQIYTNFRNFSVQVVLAHFNRELFQGSSVKT